MSQGSIQDVAISQIQVLLHMQMHKLMLKAAASCLMLAPLNMLARTAQAVPSLLEAVVAAGGLHCCDAEAMALA